MGAKSSKSSSKSLKRGKPSMRKSSHDSLGDEDVQLVKINLDSADTRVDRRMDQAKDLIASGRAISVSLEAKEEKPTKKNQKAWEDDEARERWKDQLQLMRHFYDWEEIPLDFFVDNHVGGEKNRRLSIQIAAVEPEHKPEALEPEVAASLPHNRTMSTTTPPVAAAQSAQPRPPPPQPPHKPVHHQPQPTPMGGARGRAASCAVPDRHYLEQAARPTFLEQPLPTTVPETATVSRDENHPATTNTPPIAELPSPSHRHEAADQTSALPKVAPALPPRKARAASVALGESLATAIPTVRATLANKANERDVADSREAAAVSGKSPMDIIKELKAEDSRPRRASATSIEQVYGRLGRAPARFEYENPVLAPAPASNTRARRNTTTEEKSPEQFRNLSTNIDPTQFASERRNTRTGTIGGGSRRGGSGDGESAHPAVTKKSVGHSRHSTTSTMLESKTSGTSTGDSDNNRENMSDWL